MRVQRMQGHVLCRMLLTITMYENLTTLDGGGGARISLTAKSATISGLVRTRVRRYLATSRVRHNIIYQYH